MAANEAMVEFASVTILSTARQILEEFKNHPKLGPILEEKGKRGGYLCVAEDGYGIYANVLIGSHPAAKPDTFDVAMAKAKYLLSHLEAVMSREGRNPPVLWGGGLRVPKTKLIIAFSGLPEHVDELFVIALAARLNLLSRADAIELLRQFPNDFAKPEEGNVFFL